MSKFFVAGKDYSTSSTIKLGEWNNHYTKMKEMANKQHIPMITYWTPGDCCGWCITCETDCFKTKAFKSWRAKTPYLWCFQEGYDCNVIPNKYAIRTCEIRGNVLGSFPFLWIYWKYASGQIINLRFTGRKDYLPIGGDSFPTKMINTIKWAVGDYDAYYALTNPTP